MGWIESQAELLRRATARIGWATRPFFVRDIRGNDHHFASRPPGMKPVHVKDNPARLDALAYVPERISRSPSLIVILHGCGQDGAAFAHASGWCAMADATGAVLALPLQTAANNRNLCFSWFRPEDTARGRGEAGSIRSIISAVMAEYRVDPRRVFIVGLSAGGAMAGAMLAAYPELFSAGAIVGGLPVGESTNAAEALGHMLHAGHAENDAAWARMAGAGEDEKRSWPRLSIWHGTTDRVVDSANGDNLAGQWRGLLGVDHGPDLVETRGDGSRRLAWRRDRQIVLEQWSVPRFGHGYPVSVDRGGDRWVIKAAIDATEEIAGFFGLTPCPPG